MIAISGFLVGAGTISVMVQITGGGESPYYAGLNLYILALALLMPWRLKYSAITCSLIYVSYLIPSLIIYGIQDRALFVNNNFFLLSTIVIALASTYTGYQLRFREFGGRYRLAQANEKLKALDVLKSQLFANVSHELRTPLTLILAPLETMLSSKEWQFTEKQKAEVQVMRSNGLRLLRLINNLLELARYDAGKTELKVRRGDLVPFLRGLVDGVGHLAEKKQLGIQFRAEGEIPEIPFDEEKIEKVVLNIVMNAIKFTPEGGEIRVGCGFMEEKGGVWVRVEDTGIGIPKDRIDKVFDRFSQVDPSTTRKYGGTGIGLALAKELVEMHGGKISIESEEGKGTIAEFTLPIRSGIEEIPSASADSDRKEWLHRLSAEAEKSDAVTTESMEEIQAKERSAKEKLKGMAEILVVEDSDDMRRFIRDQLREDYHIIEARDGMEGLEKVKSQMPDLIVLDIMIPEVDGYEVTRRLKAEDRTKQIPIIMVTAKVELSNKMEGLDLGADDYLIKPFSPKELKARVKNLIHDRSLQRELLEAKGQLQEYAQKLEGKVEEGTRMLIQAEKMGTLGILLSGITHEVYNPLNTVIMNLGTMRDWVEELQKKWNGDPQGMERLTEMVEILKEQNQACWQAVEVIEQMKRFVYPSKGEQEPIDVNACLELTMGVLKAQLRRWEVVTRFDSVASILGKASELNQALMNLLVNAIHTLEERGERERGQGHVGYRGRIEVETKEQGEEVWVVIGDNGCGIPQESLSEIFSPFFTTKELGQGTGLGLAISHQVIERHHGKIEVQSEIGVGTSFTLRFPVSKV
ncbi:MAG: response regulator [Deltaproteobacteria bacterium]|nr:response regulator [Deltaproteobacteria bacterium]